MITSFECFTKDDSLPDTSSDTPRMIKLFLCHRSTTSGLCRQDSLAIWSGLAMAIWSGGSRAAEAATTEATTKEGSPIWSGLAMTIWSGGSRVAEAAATEATTTEGSPI
ncbi:uncharacterized protein HKW66_Vig0248830 [Vigna angularis]|uniref:Uncharacterized protein n=1 Tax=Phaseolus angularis TaxID=3914 RepID=A0A8T0JQR6_PHAAN|nr:uncharacterized protein HKW66_Vig0248830 [Vigna angularis]